MRRKYKTYWNQIQKYDYFDYNNINIKDTKKRKIIMLSKKVNIDHVLAHFKNKRVLIRVDFNVPLKDGVVKDANRIQEAIPTIKKILEQNPKSITLMSHLGRPDGKKQDKFSMKPVLPVLEEHLGSKVFNEF